MSQELLTGTKWEILERIAQKELSPIELARTLDTTVANISMQLRLLEIASLITKRRVANSKAGRPRVLYSLKKDILYIMAASPQVQFRKFFELNAEKAFILNIWQLPQGVQGPLLSFYTNYPQLFVQGNELYYSEHGDGVVKVVLSNQKKSLPPKILNISFHGKKYGIEIEFISKEELRVSKLSLLYK